MDINELENETSPLPKRLRRKSKVSRPMALILLATGAMALVGLGIWSMRKPIAVTPVDDEAVAAKMAQERVTAARTVLLEQLLVLNPNPDSVEKAGLIQAAAIQRSNELRVYINKLRTTPGGPYYNDAFDLAAYKMTLRNNQYLVDAIRGKTNQVWLFYMPDGTVEKQTPTATQIIQQCLASDLALRMLTLNQTSVLSETQVNELFRAQGQLFNAMVESLRKGNSNEALEQFERVQNQLAAERAVPNAGGK